MDVAKLADDVLRIDLSIRYVGIVDNQYRVLASKMRWGMQSLTTDQTDRDYISIMPPIIVDALEKLEQYLGTMEAVNVRYEKALLAFYRAKEMVIVLRFGPEVVTPFLSRMGTEIRNLVNSHE